MYSQTKWYLFVLVGALILSAPNRVYAQGDHEEDSQTSEAHHEGEGEEEDNESPGFWGRVWEGVKSMFTPDDVPDHPPEVADEKFNSEINKIKDRHGAHKDEHGANFDAIADRLAGESDPEKRRAIQNNFLGLQEASSRMEDAS